MKRKFLVLGLVALLASCTAPAASGPASIEGKGAPSADIGTLGAVYTDTISGVSYRKTVLGWVVIDQAVVGTSESGQAPASSQSSQSSAASSQSGQTSNPSSGSASSSSSSQGGQTSNPSSSASTPGSSSSSATSYSPFTPGTYDWNVDTTLYGRNFMVSLGSKINATRTKTTVYNSKGSGDDCLSVGAKAAAWPNENSSTFIPFYHEAKDSEKTTTGNCNREHTWPNSRGGGGNAGGSEIENDPIMVRPTIVKDNSDRGNDVYGDVNGSWDPASLGYEGARGESARVIFYVMCCYGESHNLTLNNSTSYDSSHKVKNMGILKTLLKWHHDYPPTDWERTVCERYAKMGHARNAFVTNPEFADYIWDSNGFRTTPYNLA